MFLFRKRNMATVIRSDLRNIVLAWQAQLVLRLGWPAERVLVADPNQFTDPRGTPLHPQGDQYLLLWISDQSPDMPVFEGGGRFDTRLTVRFSVTLYTRFGVDEVSSSLAWLTDASLGHLAALGAVQNALVGFAPEDAGNDWLCTQGINPAPVGPPRREKARDPEWGVSTLGFVAVYELNLDQTQG